MGNKGYGARIADGLYNEPGEVRGSGALKFRKNALARLALDLERRGTARLLVYMPAAWRLTDAEFERLLNVQPGWLQAWRTHEVQPTDRVFERLSLLDRMQQALGWAMGPAQIAEWLRQDLVPESPLGPGTPLQAILEGGAPVIERIIAHARSVPW